MKQGKIRLDAALVEQGFTDPHQCTGVDYGGRGARQRSVCAQGVAPGKAGGYFNAEGKLKYVSRGGLKLEKALRVFPIDVQGAVCGRGCIHRRVYRLPAAKRCQTRICCGCGGMGKWPILYAMMNV